MSGLAEILLHDGFKVSGSDIKLNATCQRLQKLGVEVFEGHRKENLPQGASLLVYSSAVRADNPELLEAESRGIPVIRRAEVLAELMRLKYGVAVAGSHGKTTTTSMTAAILEKANLDPTVIIGGQVKSMGSGGKLGKGEFLVAESDESDRSFLLLKPTMAIVTNIDSEHLTAYKSFLELEESFEKFVNSVPFYGLAVLCIDDAKVRDLAQRYRGRKVTYGFSLDANLRATNIEPHKHYTLYDVMLADKKIMSVKLPMLGQHMVVNSLAAIAIGLELGISPETICEALNGFSGVGRRLETIGVEKGVTVINDYGHHPSEIKATIHALRAGWGKAIGRFHVVFQPHRYSRTKDCFADFLTSFSDCDNLIVTDIYAASEDPIPGISGEALYNGIVHSSKHYVRDLNDIVPGLVKELKDGDLVLCLGAGTVGTLPEEFLSAIKLQKV